MIARTAATGAGGLDPRFLALSSSLARDLPLLRADVLGSVAHALGLRRAGLLERDEATALRTGLLALLDEIGRDPAALPPEEDIHMALEALLKARVGAPAEKLHTGRSRNDQIAVDLRLHLREVARRAGTALCAGIETLCDLAEAHTEVVIPGYTHRQRAIPITVGHWAMATVAALLRDGAHLLSWLRQEDRCPLGAGALAGSSLPLPRAYVAHLLGFAAPTDNSLDTVGDRDGVMDLCYLSCRIHLHLSRLCTDIIDFAAQESGVVELGDDIACGSSMMPHKKNPDLFELSRGRSARAIGDLTAAVSLVRGLPLSYQRDLQEDRAMVLGLEEHLLGTLSLVDIGLRGIRFRDDTAAALLGRDATQATDLAEVLVGHGWPFRRAYQAVGGLVATARRSPSGEGLGGLTAADLHAALPEADEALLRDLGARLEPRACVAARRLPGGPAAEAVQAHLFAARAEVAHVRAGVAAVPSLDGLLSRLRAVSLD